MFESYGAGLAVGAEEGRDGGGVRAAGDGVVGEVKIPGVVGVPGEVDVCPIRHGVGPDLETELGWKTGKEGERRKGGSRLNDKFFEGHFEVD